MKISKHSNNKQAKQQKYTNAIISLKDHQSIRKLKDKQDIHSLKHQQNLSCQQISYIRQNSVLLQNFLRSKINILEMVRMNSNSQKMIQICHSKKSKQIIDQIKQTLQFLQSQKQLDLSQDMNLHQKNNHIYKTLISFIQTNHYFKQNLLNLDELNCQQIYEPNQEISNQNYNSPKCQFNTKRSYQGSTNYASRAKIKNVKVKHFQDGYIRTQLQYQLQPQKNYQNRTQTFSQDSLQQIQNQPSTLKVQDIPEQSLAEYFHHFIISLSATNLQYQDFLNQLFHQLKFESNQLNEQVEYTLKNDNQYCINIFTIALKNKFDRLVKNDKTITELNFLYFPDSKTFLELTQSFISVNMNQIIQKLKQFCNRVLQISSILDKINSIKQNQNELSQTNEQLDNLQHYFPKYSQNPLRQFTFEPKILQNLKKNILNSNQLKDNKHCLTAALNIFRKTILKIVFSKIQLCQRFNLQAVQNMFQILKDSNVVNCRLQQGFYFIKETALFDLNQQITQEHLKSKWDYKMLKKVFQSWKRIKQTKLKILNKLLKKKIKVTQKQQYLIFSRWRLNISRQRIENQLLAHSKSCNFVINQFKEAQIEDYQIKRTKKAQFRQKQKNFSSLSQISMKRQSSVKNLQKLRNFNESKLQVSKVKRNLQIADKTKDKFKLLNYQYKEQILNKINQRTKCGERKLINPVNKPSIRI